MRILFLVSSMHGGGAERVAALLCGQWALEGHDVTLMPTFSGGGVCEYPIESKVKLEYLSDKVGSTSGGVVNKIRRLAALRNFIRQENPDVIVSFLADINVVAVVATLGLKVPVIVSERTFPPSEQRSAIFNRVRRWAYARASAVVAQTSASKRWAEDLSNKINAVVIANPLVFPVPISTPVVEPASLVEDHECLLLAAGRLVEDKDYPTLISAFALISAKHPQWKLVILGEGQLGSELQALIEANVLVDKVILAGRVGNLDAWYRRADIFVMSSLREGFPNAMLEATAYGVPCVSLDFETGPREILSEGEAGIITPLAEGATGLAEGLDTLMDSKLLRAEYAASAVKNRDTYAIQTISNQWIALFKQLTARKS